MGSSEAKIRQKYKELTPDEMAKFKRRTNFSEYEIRRWHAGFYQDCPNGELDRDTFIDIFKKYYVPDQKRADSFCDYIFKMLDKDKNDKLTFEEFIVIIDFSTQGSAQERLGVAFDMYNVSDDNRIDEEELANFILAMYNLAGETDRKGDRDPKKFAKAIIAQFDMDGDKKLDRDEFIAACVNQEYLAQILVLKPEHGRKNDGKNVPSRSDTQA